MKQPKKDGRPSTGRIADARFASFETDPRYRLPSKKHAKTTIDKRFSAMLVEEDFISNAKVDRYGRKIKSDSKKKALERLYRVESDNEDDDDDDDDEDEDEETGDQGEIDDDELVQRELRAAHELDLRKKRDPARDGGFSCSESDSSSDDDSEEEGGDEVADNHGGMQRLQDEQAGVESGQVTNRIAIVNLDWDHIKSTDLMALFSSFIPPNSGRIVNISIYPSEFGKERMQQEETEGPPKALFKDESKLGTSSDDDDSDSDEAIKKELIEEGDDQDFNSDALRSYQLDRLRYFYAVMVCSDAKTAHAIYEATDGTEYQASSNFIDLRFVPDDVTFDDEPRDQCSEVPDSYKPVEFVTNALQSSKVKLTWDMHPEEASRKKSIQKAFSQSRAEMEENDLRTYLASDSEDEPEKDEAGDEAIMTRREAARRKMREALGITDDATVKRSKDGPVGEMQITFAPALAGGKAEETAQEETTIEKYRRKERERKEKKRQGGKSKAEVEGEEKDEQADEDLGFNDPFFMTDEPSAAATSKSAMRKEERRKRREEREAAEAEAAEQKAKLSGIMAKEADGLEHFDMKEIVRAEKDKGKGRKKKKKKTTREEGREGLMQEGFEMDLGDDRFQAVFDSHEFAIDPSNPKFKATSGMKKLLEEVREKKNKKRKAGDEEMGRERERRRKRGNDDD
ncbi:hypothetical protein CP532_6143 [Ophiocordyceps camponoti-leonardi (nom. inval.)]|nr:hypothetical protein CP532_6143 [Ophiocordyceps camponoti-leonardi (nom. inval.)]